MTTNFDFAQSREYLQAFDFSSLFRESLGWSKPTSRKGEEVEIEEAFYQRRMIAQVSGVAVYEVESPDGRVPGEKVRKSIQEQTAELSLEHLLIFVDVDRTQSYWYWVKRDGKKLIPRHLSYYKGQSGDLILGKLSGLVFELKDFEAGDPAVVEVARRLQSALDVEKVTKKFYRDFKVHLEYFVEQIQGIDDNNDRRWYASVILNRLMFVYFLQYKGFVDGNPNYLRDKLELFEGKEFYRDFLKLLFFEGFAKAAPNRSPQARQLLGEIKYLNGGLFLEHRIERDYQIKIDNEAFERTLVLFKEYSWNLDDAPGGEDYEIRPEVLGYIFEKYINQKDFGAYYTRPEITEYLCDRTINKLVLDKVNSQARRKFETLEDLLFNLDADLCLLLLEGILPKLSLLDPACGSGAFLVSAMKTLINVYSAIVGRIKFIKNPTLTKWLQDIEKEHPSIQYYIKKRIITDNLYGVDIMEEATEITKLRLFLALVASAAKLEELEPLPNVDFNIMAGNSLIGLIGVDENGFDAVVETSKAKKRRKEQERLRVEPVQVNLLEEKFLQVSLFQTATAMSYRQILEEKNRSIALFKERAFANPEDTSPESEIRTEMLKSSIEELNRKSQAKLNKLLFDEFGRLGIQYEEAQPDGKAKKRLLNQADIDALEPFHWGYHFDEVIREQGGFDVVIANPPWEVFQPTEKEFFNHYSDIDTRKMMNVFEFTEKRDELLQNPNIQRAWLSYCSAFPHQNAYFKKALQYSNQTSHTNGKKIPGKNNLYKIFVEQCFNLLKKGGLCGMILPTGFYSDGHNKQLRELLFSSSQLGTIFGLSNERYIFEDVDHRQKFCIFSFKKGGLTRSFKAAFRIDPREAVRPSELNEFFSRERSYLKIDTALIYCLSPDQLLIPEFNQSIDITIANKLISSPPIGDKKVGQWNLELATGFDKKASRELFELESKPTNVALYGGGMIHHFNCDFAKPKYYIDIGKGRTKLAGRVGNPNQTLTCDDYRLLHRRVARQTDTRTLICSIIPPRYFCDNSVNYTLPASCSRQELTFVCGVFSSFVFDFQVRSRLNSNVTKGLINQLSLPRLQSGDCFFAKIVDRAAKLICTTPEFDDLAAEVGLGSHTNGITDEIDRARLRAELDGIIAHLYHLTEPEFTHILSTFPIVPQATKDAALQAYRDFAPPDAEPEIIALLQQGESGTVEFKSTARWNLRDSKKDRIMEEVILKTVAAFLNSQGGTLLIGVADDGSILGLDPDYQTLKKRDRDGFELWLMGDLLLKEMGKAIAPSIGVTFHTVDQNEICKIVATPAPEPVYVEIADKSGQAKETFFIRTGNSTNKLDKPSEISKYLKQRWER
jgi:hypothetical protein